MGLSHCAAPPPESQHPTPGLLALVAKAIAGQAQREAADQGMNLTPAVPTEAVNGNRGG